MNVNYQIYIEYGTMQRVQSTAQEGISIQAAAASESTNYSMGITMEMTLQQDIQP